MQVRDRLDLLPLRQMVAANGDAALVFARHELLDWLSKPDRFQITCHGRGGQILAASELALAEAQVLLWQAYGDLIAFGATSVHTYVDPKAGTLMVPVMFLRIDVPRWHRQELSDMLRARGAQIKEIDIQRNRVVIRVELELRQALDLQRQVQVLTDGSAHYLSWLLGYRPAVRGEQTASFQGPVSAHDEKEPQA